MLFSVDNTYTADSLGASTTENHGMSPFQYSSTVVLGVPPPINSIKSLKDVINQPFGTQPNSVSSNSLGKSERIFAGSGLKSALLRTFDVIRREFAGLPGLGFLHPERYQSLDQNPQTRI